jgi:Fic family protein
MKDRQEMLETPARIEPCLLEGDIPARLADLAADVRARAERLGHALHPDAATELADLVRLMNCYYSNLIEGHVTRPRDIELALANADLDEARRPLALEARAHVLIQRRIDQAFAAASMAIPTSVAFITETHHAFYAEMPEQFRFAKGRDGARLAITPGAFRARPDEDVAVGRHLPPSSERIADFMTHYERRFARVSTTGVTGILAIATAHHRFNFIHPFLDGNGRVSRLMSHAMALRAGIGGGGLWSLSRGFARGLVDRGEYRRMMDHADSPRQGDRDGRGNLSEAALKDFTEWVLKVMLDQLEFTQTVFQIDALQDRLRRLLSDLGFGAPAVDLTLTILRYGEVGRGDVPKILKLPERTARTITAKLQASGILKSSTPKGPLRIGFPIEHRERLFPRLFGDEPFTV